MQDMVTRTLQSQGLYRFDPNQFSYGLWNEANRQYWWLRQQEEWYKQQQAMQELTDDDFSDDEDGAVLKGNKQSGKSSESYRVLESF
ncbi:hypothetical protein GNI_053870 [Gregarina niphandrodes]|uniref:Uncharacterized protein n=1 Tax=Gregarina niphandrodes TaxID=110365 RepID=A0A023B924_GRENI|nr:hypothetical protein GNI_053870 [Gregarina niphandrodes]EZG70938.1 hypothetical protein GNI_053870 [Gregarina niphandrodes]|eukprot:XP_011129853.1 hypothetical protein GNI_053870 [Gregarina niphandrodes]